MATELLLTGLLLADHHTTVTSTLSNMCERGEAFSLSEKVVKRRGAATGDVRIRVRALRLKSEQLSSPAGDATRWSLTVLHKPEPARISPSALQYSVSEISIRGGVHPEELAHAFGFEEQEFELKKRGTRWERSGVLIEVFQLFPDEISLAPLDPKTFVVQASVRFSQPAPSSSASSASAPSGMKSVPNITRTSTPNPGTQSQPAVGGGGKSGQEERDRALNALEAIKKALKGVVDLKRME
ncbi:hypothetical protein JCM11491_000468 [Sporobolomyces phaffii]